MVVDASYELTCTDCSFHANVSGTFSDALQAAHDHRVTHDAGPTGHFVNIHRH